MATLPQLLSENVVVIFHEGKSYRLLGEKDINSWKIRICAPTLPKKAIADNIVVFVETVDCGNNAFWLERDKSIPLEEYMESLYEKLEKNQMEQTIQMYESWKAWRRSEKKSLALS